jgi:hypothetical protein
MCINLKTSISAFLIGGISSLVLIKSNNKENISIGKFILFYTFIQLFEALIYYNNLTIYSRLLLLNLGLQGLVFMIQLNNYIPINKNYIYICAIISIFITYKSLQTNFKKASTQGCMKWNFFDNTIINVLYIMYGMIFISIYHYSDKLNNINKLGLLFILTASISIYISKMKSLLCSINKPSIWCLSSALIAPIMLLFDT